MVATPGALESLNGAEQDPLVLISRHVIGDWGDLHDEDKQENELRVEQGFRILSAYTLNTGVRVWIITEADRSSTNIFLPSEYLTSLIFIPQNSTQNIMFCLGFSPPYREKLRFWDKKHKWPLAVRAQAVVGWNSKQAGLKYFN